MCIYPSKPVEVTKVPIKSEIIIIHVYALRISDILTSMRLRRQATGPGGHRRRRSD